MAGIWQHPKSKNFWFRMAVPEKLRARVGRREIKYSLETTDPNLARLRHADKLGEVRALFARLESETLASIGNDADDICRRGLGALARRNLRFNDDGVTALPDAEDNVAYGMLNFLAYRTRATWGQDHADLAELELVGDLNEPAGISPSTLPLGFIDADDQDRFVARSKALERDIRYRGYANRDIAQALLARRSWAAAESEVLLVASAADAVVKTRTPLFDALAERVLRHLAVHRFRSWPASIDQVIQPMAMPEGSDVPAPVEAAPAQVYRLDDALSAWCFSRGLKREDSDKTLDEWKLAVARFTNLHGDLSLDRITRAMVTEFRDILSDMPARAKKAIAVLPVRQQIAIAAKDGLPTLAPPSVKKNVGAIRSLLEIAFRDKEWTTRNVAVNITVAGASHVGDERDRLTDVDMRTIYGSPLMTDPNACDDTMFWIMFMAPFQGARPGEHCKLQPSDVCYEDGVPIVRIRRRRRQNQGTEAERRGQRQKTLSSVRDVPLHWILEEAGFMEFAALQKWKGAEWLFDNLVPDKYGDRYKLLSRRINKALDGLGISGAEKAFYSTRHTMKRETRRKRVPEHNADQLAGHSDGRTGRKYGQGSSMEDLKEDIDKLEFAGVDWDAVVACARTRVTRYAAQVA